MAEISPRLRAVKSRVASGLLGAAAEHASISAVPYKHVLDFEVQHYLRTVAPPLVHAVGLGFKVRHGERTEQMSIRVYVTRKTDQLGLSQRIPREIDGVATDVIEAPIAMPIAAACSANRQSKQSPIIGGIGTSHYSGDTGTIGYFCNSTDPADSASDIFVLSNEHIYGKLGGAGRGDALLQPGAHDGGTLSDQIARYHRGVPLVFGGARNTVDAAIGMLDAGVSYQAEVCGIGKVNGTARAEEDDVVAKHGRTSGYTEGVVDDELIDFIMFPSNSQNFIQFRDQIRIVPRDPYTVIASQGDSGSLVVRLEGNSAVGLLHAAAPDGSYAYGNHIDEVERQLQVVLL